MTVGNLSGSVTSVIALLNIQIPPFLTEQPKDISSVISGAALFTVDAAGTEPFACRWLFNGVEVVGANTNFLAVPNVQVANSETYQVMVSNPFGTVPSRLASLKVVTPPSLTRQPADASGFVCDVLRGSHGHASVFFSVAQERSEHRRSHGLVLHHPQSPD